MAKFTLIERPGTGVEEPPRNPPPPNNVGDQLLNIDRQLEDKRQKPGWHVRLPWHGGPTVRAE